MITSKRKEVPCRCAVRTYPHRRSWHCEEAAQAAKCKRHAQGDIEAFKAARDTREYIESTRVAQ